MEQGLCPKIGNNEVLTNESLVLVYARHSFSKQGPLSLKLILEARLARELSYRCLTSKRLRGPIWASPNTKHVFEIHASIFSQLCQNQPYQKTTQYSSALFKSVVLECKCIVRIMIINVT